MSLFKRKTPGSVPEVESFTEWRIVTVMPDDTQCELHGHLYCGADHADALRYVDAIADGLRRGGFASEVTLIREREETR